MIPFEMPLVPYLELLFLSLVIVFFLYAHYAKMGGVSDQVSRHKRFMISGAVLIMIYTLDSLLWFGLGDALPPVWHYVCDLALKTSLYVTVCLFFGGALFTFKDKAPMMVRLSWLLHLIFLVLCILTPVRLSLFWSDFYTRTPLYNLWYVPLGLPCLILIVHSGIAYFDKQHYSEREDHANILKFCLLLVVFGLLDVLWPASAFLPIGLTLGMILCYFQNITAYISRDELTDLYNRRQLFRDMERKASEDKKWGIIMLDLDGFKSINDTYGHHEGDVALQLFAGVLKRVCRGKNARPYRYGGDEFVIVKDSWTGDIKKELDEIKSDVVRRLQILDITKHKGYTISASMGSVTGSKADSVPDLINLADSELYEDKQK
ncbi:MAG: GGDEF domain-containing protein [Abditibacteriota bacterium]|nr:GGDEF domain-containing protein [Abditibacteriota bacterium]